MPRYFFDFTDCAGFHADDTGTACVDHAAARLIALQTLPAVAADQPLLDSETRAVTIYARDEVGQPVYTATLSCVGAWLKEQD